MICNTAFAEAFVNAAAKAINTQGKQAPWPARQVVDRVTYTKIGTVRVTHKRKQPITVEVA